MKRSAEINGQNWIATYPFCEGCDELVLSGGGWECGYRGNGCKYPEERIKKPKGLYTAFVVLFKMSGLTLEQVREMELEKFPEVLSEK